MPTAGEKKALWFLAIVALSGSAVRVSRGSSASIEPADAAALESQIARVDSVRARDRTTHGRRDRPHRMAPVHDTTSDSIATPTGAGLVDLDRATEAEIEALPGIGPALAHRIVSYRDSAGAFGQIDAICDVPGIGPALAKRLRPLVTFTGARRPLSDACGEASTGPRASRGSRNRKLR